MPAWVTSPPESSRVVVPARTAGTHRRLSRDRLLLALLCTLTFVLGCLRGATRPFWFDEVATAHIAGAPTWQQMLTQSQQVDLHPPLEPFLVRLSFALFGPHEFAGHLPSVLAFTLALGCLFLFLRRRVSALFALFGALLPLANAEVFAYATEARPYGLLFGCVCLGVLAYDSVLREDRPALARVVLAFSLVGMLQAHLFGTFAAGGFLLAEAVRTVRFRRVDALTWMAVLLPLLTCVTYIPLLRIQAAGHGSPMIYEEKDRTSLTKGLRFFHQTLFLPLAPLLKFSVLVLLFGRFFPTRRFALFFRLSPELAALLLALLASPVLVTLLLHVRAPGSGFFPRYAIAAVCPAMLLLAGLIAWRAGDDRRIALLLAAGAVFGAALSFRDTPEDLRTVAHHGLFGAPAGLAQTGGVEQVCPTLPLAVNDPLEFFEADFRLGPTLESRMVYPSDAAASLRLEHENATQAVGGMSRVFHTPHHVVPGPAFLAAHPDFLLLTRPRHTAWLGDALNETHARLQPLGPRKFAGSNMDLWLVTQPAAGPFPATPNCPAH